MSFNDGSYFINENARVLQPLLVLSNPSSFVETVEVQNQNFFTNPIFGMLVVDIYVHTYHVHTYVGYLHTYI